MPFEGKGALARTNRRQNEMEDERRAPKMIGTDRWSPRLSPLDRNGVWGKPARTRFFLAGGSESSLVRWKAGFNDAGPLSTDPASRSNAGQDDGRATQTARRTPAPADARRAGAIGQDDSPDLGAVEPGLLPTRKAIGVEGKPARTRFFLGRSPDASIARSCECSSHVLLFAAASCPRAWRARRTVRQAVTPDGQPKRQLQHDRRSN